MSRKVKLIAVKGMAFVEFEDDSQSSLAFKGLHGFKMTAQHNLAISYARLK